uniref:EOG090X09NR n=1 Tax=Lynceus sp. MCZ IZ 141354 TaxID=1930659 RepID=A0A9N6ZFX8_9CRUS|nr:EOG090X09NR [Lynceus sp. MCZ IZ 141354]
MNQEKDLIMKKVIHAGKSQASTLVKGTKVNFHFRTIIPAEDGGEDQIIDDSKARGKAMELVLGKQFKLEVWESALQMMSIGEVSEFTVDKNLCVPYPFVAKTLRDSYWGDGKKAKQEHRHCCGAMAMQQDNGLGYKDLDDLVLHPKDLKFVFELLSAEQTQATAKDSWELDENEKLNVIPQLREEGNMLYKSGDISGAKDKYAKAIGILEQLLLREKPGDEDWLKLDYMKIPFLLNFAQCMYKLGEFYNAIEQCNEVLKRDSENVKALYRRGLSHIKVWNPVLAKEDLQKAMTLDSSLEKSVLLELRQLEDMQKCKNQSDKQWLKKLFSV